MPIITTPRLPQRLAALFAAALLPLAAHAGTYSWHAGSGLTPDQADARMALNDTAPGSDPLLAGGLLTLATQAQPELMLYMQSGAAIDMPAQLVIEAQMRLGPGSSTNPGPGSPRSHAGIFFNVADSVGNALFFGHDRLFLLAGDDVLGSSAVLDTDDGFHDYRIEVAGTGAGAAISVFQDGLLVLSGSTFAGNPIATVARVGFGDGTLAAQGSSQWRHFSHNASASVVPEPASALLALAGLGLLALNLRRER